MRSGRKEKEITADKNAAENAEKDFAEAESALENHEKQETEWKKQSEKLTETDKILAQWEARSQEAESLCQELDAVAVIPEAGRRKPCKSKEKTGYLCRNQ